MPSDLFAPLFSTDGMKGIFGDGARIRAMLAFEKALAEAEGEAGVIPTEAAGDIARACDTFQPDIAALATETRRQVTLAIPFVKALTAHCGDAGRGWVHWGATSQDVVDTGLILQVREALTLLDADLRELGDTLAILAHAHRDTPMAGRTLMQPALPITFGFKCAGWLDAVADTRLALSERGRETVRLQFGGAVGTLSALGDQADEVRVALGRRLALPVPDLSWHTSRGRLVRLAGELAVLAGTVSKIAGDLLLLSQPEVGEVMEHPQAGRGGSSTMPQKRNPVSALAARSAAARAPGLAATLMSAMDHEHERAAGGWQVEWTTIPDLFQTTAAALRHLCEAVASLDVDKRRMRANLEIGQGTLMSKSLMMALAPHVGRGEAHRLVGELARRALGDVRPLAEVAAEDETVAAHLDRAAIARALDPTSYLGRAGASVDAANDRWKTIASMKPGER